MGFYAASQPRSFISNGQLAQNTDENMETSQTGVDVAEQESDRTEDAIEVFEITLSSTEPEETEQDILPTKVATAGQLSSPQVKKEAECISLLAEMYRRGGFVSSSSGSDESVGADCARKVEAMSPSKVQSETVKPCSSPKASYSEAIRLAPVGQFIETS